MPHKHKRKRDDGTDFDLPPSQVARPLAVTNSKSGVFQPATKKKGKGKGKGQTNDAPRAFRRLMAVASGKKIRSGLDDGAESKTATAKTEAAVEMPTIRPGEDMRTFGARVDAALPVSGLTKKTVVKDGKDSLGFKVMRTRKERKMHKLYDQWYAEERKIQSKREEELEEEAERGLENDAAGITTSTFLDEDPTASVGKNKKKKKSRRGGGGTADEDPWQEITRKRARDAKFNPHGSAQQPPELHKGSTKQIRVMDEAEIARRSQAS